MNNQMKEILDKYASFNTQPVEELTPDMARQQPELRDAVLGVINDHAAKRLFTGVVEPVKNVEHITIAGPGGQILLRVYTPPGDGIRPATLYYHGGGMVIASMNTYDSSCRALANAADCVVISVGYRQAPEHRYPAAREDAFAAYQWVLQNSAMIGIDPERVAVTGESAGGNLAAVVCLMAREQGFPQPVHQALIYPMLDARMDSPSYEEHANAKPLNKAMMAWFWSHYLEHESDREDPLACPLRAQSFSGLAPATIVVAEIDPLRSDGETYAERLRASGVPVSTRFFEGVTHEFFGMGAVLTDAKNAVSFVAEHLQIAFGEEEPNQGAFGRPIDQRFFDESIM